MTADNIVQLVLGVLTLIGVIVAALIARDSRQQVSAIRVATTVNHHSSDPPTLPDRLDTVQQSIAGLKATVDAHHQEQQRRNDAQDERLARGLVRFSEIDARISRYHPEPSNGGL